VLITGFSPDSSRLLFYQGEVHSEEGAVLPKGVVQGFHELTLADLSLAPKTSLESFIDFTADGRHVILVRSLPDRTEVLTRFDLDTGSMEELQKGSGSVAFMQLVLHGERIVFTDLPGTKGQVVADTLRGGERIELSPEGEIGQYQMPQISLDGHYVTYNGETMLMIRTFEAEAAARVLIACTINCNFAWDSATTLLVLEGEQLARVSVDGTVTPLAKGVEGFAVAGAPG
jgi:Tol biopolymer transport system component